MESLTVSSDFLGPVLSEPFAEVIKRYGSESYPSGSVKEDVLLDSVILAELTCPLQVLEYNASRSKEDFFRLPARTYDWIFRICGSFDGGVRIWPQSFEDLGLRKYPATSRRYAES